MRIALIADIHGNLAALDAVVSAIDRQSVDQILCLGDVAIFGPQPRETLARLQAVGCPVVMGNTDAWALDPQPLPTRNEESGIFNEIEWWGAQQLSAADQVYLRTFQPVISLALGDGLTLLAYHGSPYSYNDPIVATTPDAELGRLLGAQTAQILAGGHTHAQYVRRYQDKFVLNPGSVGLPYETRADGTVRNPPWAEYGIINWTDGQLAITMHRAPYDIAPLLAAVQTSGMPHADWWSSDWG